MPWSHYLKLIQVKDLQIRLWYEREAALEGWDVRTLQRNISTQYFERLLISKDRDPVVDEMHKLTADYQRDAKRFVKNPYVLEFLDLPEDPAANESMLESALITNIGRFLMELGRGYAFVARQQHIRTEKEDYYMLFGEGSKLIPIEMILVICIIIAGLTFLIGHGMNYALYRQNKRR